MPDRPCALSPNWSSATEPIGAKEQHVPATGNTDPTNLVHLPSEILAHISSHLSVSDARSLALVSKHFTPIADKAIWRDLHLSLPPSYGRRPMDPPIPVLSNQAEREGEAAKTVERRVRAGLRRKLWGLARYGDSRKMAMVQSITMMSRPWVDQEMVYLLDSVRFTLQKLEIRGTQADYDYSLDDFWRPPDEHCLDHLFLESHLYFPSLTHLRLIDEPLRFFQSLPLLCNSAPNLRSLIVQMNVEPRFWSSDFDPPTMTFARHTRLQALRVELEGGWANEAGTPSDPILDLLRHSPDLREVGLFEDLPINNGPATCQVLEQLSALSQLDFLFLRAVNSGVFRDLLSELQRKGLNTFPQLKTLMLDDNMDHTLPELEVLLYCGIYWFNHDFSAKTPDRQAPVQAFIPRLRDQLLGSPRLHQIRCLPVPERHIFPTKDEYLSESYLIYEVSSICHRGDELLIARYSSDQYEESDEVWDPFVDYGYSVVRYATHDGVERIKKFDEVPEDQVVRRDHTDWCGMIVPLDVIEKMRVMEGLTADQWKGRGIQVGDAAWKVLTDWKASV